MAEYLKWELSLVDQIKEDGDAPYVKLLDAKQPA